MALTTLAEVKLLLGVSDASQDVPLSLALAAADGVAKAYCKRDLERRVYTEYRDGPGTPDLVLRQRPARVYLLAGNLTAGSAVVTGLSSTSDLAAGLPASLYDHVASGSTVASVDSPTQVTLSAAATRTGAAQTIAFGIAAWVDAAGFYGAGVQPFAARQEVFHGRDYVLTLDGGPTSGKSGLLRRLGGGPALARQGDWWWPLAPGGRGTLTARLPSAWAPGVGNIKIAYTAGYTAAEVPADLKLAVGELAVWIYRYAPQGGVLVVGEHYEDFGYQLGKLHSEPDLASVRQILTRYRSVSL